MFRNVLTVLIISTFVFMSGCQKSSGAKPAPKTIPYVEYQKYNDDVLPRLDQGYSVIEHTEYLGPNNKTRDEIIKKAKALKANLVMVKSDFGFDKVAFEIYYLKEPLKDNSFGAQFVEMPLHIRQNFGSNLGCTLGDISYGTPAYNADLHKDDVITKVNGKVVTSCRHFKKLIRKRSSVKLDIWADGKNFSTDLKLRKKSKSTSKSASTSNALNKKGQS